MAGFAVPLKKPEDVIPHLGSATHWKQGRSAKSLADAWVQENGLPPRVRAVLASAPDLASAELIDAWFERSTDLEDSRGTASQTDLLALVGIGDRTAVLAVEAKVTEPFGDPVTKWLGTGAEGKQDRLTRLCDLLNLDQATCGDLRYQLFHRAAAAVLEARRFRTDTAVLLVHSFCPDGTGLSDFVEFGRRLGFESLGRDQISEPRTIGGVKLRLAWVSDEPVPGTSKKFRSVQWLTDFSRTRLSKSFFMRDFLFSDIAAVHGFSNIPDDPELAIAAGTSLCEELLEPLQDTFGRLSIRSAFRSEEVNGFGNEMQKRKAKGYTCASNEANFAGHIWDRRDRAGNMGATACIVIPSIWDRFKDEPGGWQRLAWWIHDHLPYSSLHFFPTYWAFNIRWRENPERRIDSYVAPEGCLTKPAMANHDGSHVDEWGPLLARF